MRNILRHIFHLPRNLIVLLITGYQHTLSPDHGPLKHLHPYGFCPHSPTCSQYGKEIIQKRGAVLGSVLAAKRIITCGPWTKVSGKKLMEITRSR